MVTAGLAPKTTHSKQNLKESLFIPFSCLNASARYSCAELNWSGQKGHPRLVPDLGGKTFNISPFSDMQVFHRCPLSVWGNSFLFFVCICYLEWVFNFVKYFFCISWNDMIFPLYFVNMLVNWCFSSVKSILHSWDISHLVMLYYLFISNILLNIFMIMFTKSTCVCAYMYLYTHVCTYIYLCLCHILVSGRYGLIKPHTQVLGIFLLHLHSVRVSVNFHYFFHHSRIHHLGSTLPLC